MHLPRMPTAPDRSSAGHLPLTGSPAMRSPLCGALPWPHSRARMTRLESEWPAAGRSPCCCTVVLLPRLRPCAVQGAHPPSSSQLNRHACPVPRLAAATLPAPCPPCFAQSAHLPSPTPTPTRTPTPKHAHTRMHAHNRNEIAPPPPPPPSCSRRQITHTHSHTRTTHPPHPLPPAGMPS